ncbi:hypothetical protein HNQ80_001515 [Anaerosolibacter carboniphilus]|uniref:Uncharacterized protein n=1 Tax=Anaerosolibacter carboniphilus TaxID=1417629 RepID=A0A841KPN4_9FIRM|nr:hypothetical protein [Anaerosolibacter carboniphilus]
MSKMYIINHNVSTSNLNTSGYEKRLCVGENIFDNYIKNMLTKPESKYIIKLIYPTGVWYTRRRLEKFQQNISRQFIL